jgi:hypothetical protein
MARMMCRGCWEQFDSNNGRDVHHHNGACREQPAVLTFDQFSERNGVSATPPSFPEYHRGGARVSGPSRRAADARVAQAMQRWGEARDSLRAQYQALIDQGRVREPAGVETLNSAAAGDGPAAEAARRVLARRAAR